MIQRLGELIEKVESSQAVETSSDKKLTRLLKMLKILNRKICNLILIQTNLIMIEIKGLTRL